MVYLSRCRVQVMCLKNLDVAAGLVNGARGVVTAMVSNATSGGGKLWPEVKFACGVTQVMTPETWSVLEADSVVAERKQVCAMVCARRKRRQLSGVRGDCRTQRHKRRASTKGGRVALAKC